MKINIIKDRMGERTQLVQIDGARFLWPNFEGRGDKFNTAGNRNFNIIIPTQEIADALVNDLNEFGVGWNVKIKAPREEGDEPFMYLPIKVKFNSRGPEVVLISGNRTVELTEETIGMLDNIDIESVDLDIRPYDDEGAFGPFRSAYLSSMEVTQKVSRFAARRQEREELPFF